MRKITLHKNSFKNYGLWHLGTSLLHTGSLPTGEGGGRGRVLGFLFLLLLSACTSSNDIEEIVGEDSAFYLEASAMLGEETTSAKTTRAHWNEDNKFEWDNSQNEMVVIVKKSSSGAIIPWGTNKSCTAKVKNITTEDDYESIASITSNSGILKTEIREMTVGQTPVYFFSPILSSENESTISADGVVTLKLPSTFAQDATPSMEDFKNYTYIKGESTISEINNGKLQAASTRFTALPAVIRFAVTNDRGESVKINSITVSVPGGKTGGFPKTMTWTPGSSTEPTLVSSASDTEGLYTTLTANMGSGYTLAARETAGASANFYAFLFPSTFSGARLTLTGEDGFNESFTYHCDIPEKTFVSNRIYTWNLTVEDNFLRMRFYEEKGLFQW